MTFIWKIYICYTSKKYTGKNCAARDTMHKISAIITYFEISSQFVCSTLRYWLSRTRPNIGGHYFHTWCPYVNPIKQKQTTNKIRATTDTMRENNKNLSAVAWWVILNSQDLFQSIVSFMILKFMILKLFEEC